MKHLYRGAAIGCLAICCFISFSRPLPIEEIKIVLLMGILAALLSKE